MQNTPKFNQDQKVCDITGKVYTIKEVRTDQNPGGTFYYMFVEFMAFPLAERHLWPLSEQKRLITEQKERSKNTPKVKLYL
jgi:hypothetical protein